MTRNTGPLKFGGAFVALTLIAACDLDLDTSDAPLDTPEQRASYLIGRDIGRQVSDFESNMDFAALMRGLSDGMDGSDPPLPEDELRSAMQTVQDEIDARKANERSIASAANIEAGDAYREENASRPEVSTTASGLQYEVLREGEGNSPATDDRVRLHYRGTLVDGTEFDASYGGDPAEFSVGGVIEGFAEAIQLMREGSHFRVVIPPDIGYGASGAGNMIGPDATLVFEIELIEIVEGG